MEEKVDVIIVGTGAAGLFCALHLPKTCKVLMVTKDIVEHSDSYLAQGGISTLLNEEDYESYYEDTMKAGHYENRKESVEIMIRSSRDIINKIMSFPIQEKGPILPLEFYIIRILLERKLPLSYMSE